MDIQNGGDMPRVVIEACAACHKKDGTVRKSDVELTLDGKTWFLCDEHESSLAMQFVSLLGDPCEEEDK
jgi:hypothetical protein